MSEKYLPVSSLEQAQKLTVLLWKLTNPDPSEDQVTRYYSEPIKHPKTGEVRLLIESKQFEISKNADVYLFDDLLAEAIKLGIAAKSDILEVQANIENNKGKFVILQEVLPSTWTDRLSDQQTLEKQGWVF